MGERVDTLVKLEGSKLVLTSPGDEEIAAGVICSKGCTEPGINVLILYLTL